MACVAYSRVKLKTLSSLLKTSYYDIHCYCLYTLLLFMVSLPYIPCNGTCFVHKIFRLDAIERYIVTIYHIAAIKGFPK